MASSSRILANLTDNTSATIAKAATHPTSNQKQHVASKKLGLTQSSVDNVPKRKTIGTFQPENLKTESLFSVPASSKPGAGDKENFKSKKKSGGKPSVHGNSKSKIYQDALNSEDYHMIRNGQPTEKYWELLAEERRKGLAVALKQNKKLHEENEKKDEVIAELRHEVADLRESLEHAEHVASIVEKLLAGTENEDAGGKDTLNNETSQQLLDSSGECSGSVNARSCIAQTGADDNIASKMSPAAIPEIVQSTTRESSSSTTDETQTASLTAGDDKQKDE